MHKKCYQDEKKKVKRRMFLAVTEIMFCMVSQIFKSIEIFVFNFPPGASSFDEYFDIRLINGNVGYPAAMKGYLVIGNEGIFKNFTLSACSVPFKATSLTHS